MAAVYGVLLAGIICLNKQYVKVKTEADTYKNNVNGLLAHIESLSMDSIQTGYQVQSLNLKLDEYKKYRADDAALIQSLNIKLKNVQSVSKQELDVSVPIQTVVRHDTVFMDSIKQDVQTIQYKDPYVSLDGTIKNDSLKAVFDVPITLTQVVHKVPKHKFLWWSWGCKAIKQAITSDNPYAKIKYTEYIEITK